VRIEPGISPTTRLPPGPISSASCLISTASPGRSPLEIARAGNGTFTEVDNTQPRLTGPGAPPMTARATRSPARNTESNAARHCSSVLSRTPPLGGPPTLISAPSRRPKVSTARAAARAAVSGAARSAVRATAA